ncbi:hypothetical protein [Paenibacillus sp. P32E]|uniref:hypothetical protein n=1 Tax=Paenibacillus sp. P32E TaxID=1349434 RepID=UPI00093957D8|nr:hypothetical protein [Paenibacillus sp. P32E]OKP89739.1 hypothetical protein A3848_13175 [Paenibacillus sp. P32E]
MSKKYFSFLVCFLSILVFSSSVLADKIETFYFYNAAGRLIEVSNSSGTTMNQYDSNGNLVNKYRTNNLLANSNFEAYSGLNGIADGWNKSVSQGVSGGYEVVTSPITQGNRAQKITAVSLPNTGDGMNVWKDVPTSGNTLYRIKGRLKLENMVNTQLSIIILFYDKNNQMVGGQTPVEYSQNTMDWATFSGNFTTPINAVTSRLHIHLHATSNNAKATVYADGISIELGEVANLLFNGEFKGNYKPDGTADGWNRYVGQGINGEYKVINSQQTPNRMLQQIKAIMIPNKGDGMNVWQDISTSGGKLFNLTGYLQLEDMLNSKLSVIVYFYDKNNDLIGGQAPTEFSQSTSRISFSGNFTTPANTTTMRVHFHLYATANNARGTVYVDSISLNPK